MSKATDVIAPDTSAHHEDHDYHSHIPKGITRWLFTTNHKDIGTLYLWFAFIMFLIGGAMAMAMAPPIKNMIKANHKYKVPISLWLVVNSHRVIPFGI